MAGPGGKNDTKHKYELAVAIDFGTTYSGYAYSYRYDKEKIYVNANWSSGSAMWKVPTAILFDQNHKFLAFGEEAENMYNEYAECEEEQQYYYFHRFKMLLYKEKRITRDVKLFAANGKSMKAVNVFASAIEYLKDHLIRTLNERNAGNQLSVNKIRWILTVPAIWNDAAKQFMREAAIMAKILSESLIVALEPECASLYIQSLPEEKLHSIDVSKVGAKYMVLDSGGGTIDVTVHQLLLSGSVKELYKATGGAWGGTQVDQAFEDYLTAMLSNTVIERIKKEYPSDWVDMMRSFEKIKRSINRENNNQYVLFVLKPCVREIYLEVMQIDFLEAFRRQQISSQGASMRGANRLQIPRTLITEMIDKTAQNVNQHVSNLLKKPELRNIDFITMVGGFSNSYILVDQIRKLAGSIPLILPEDAELAVVKGAVIFGWKPNAITIRKTKKCYGVSMVSDFKEGEDPERLKIKDDDGVTKCKMIFDKLVSVNQEIEAGKKVSRNYFPVYNNQTEMNIILYESENPNVKYCDQEDVQKVGCLVVPMPNVVGNKGRKVAVDLQFGDTEFCVGCRDLSSGKVVKAQYDFLKCS